MNRLLVNSLPKSGTHLLIKLLETMGYQFTGANFSSSTLYGRNTLPKYFLRGVIAGQSGVDMGLEITAVARRSWVTGSLNRVRDNEYCAGHLPYSDCMYALVKQTNLKPIHIIRDPRDVLVSWAHYVPKTNWHYGRLGLEGLDLEQRIKKILYGYQSGPFYIESFIQVLKRSLGWLKAEGVLVVRFEDLVGRRGGGDDRQQINTIEKIASFVDVENVDTEKMTQSLFGGTKVFRKGQVGGWREEIRKDLIDEVKNVIGEVAYEMSYQL